MGQPAGLLHGACLISLFGFSMIACGSSRLPSTQTATAPSTSTKNGAQPPVIAATNTIVPFAGASTPVGSKTGVNFKVAVIVDTFSEPVPREQAKNIIEEASKLVQPFVIVGFEMVDFVEDSGGGKTKDIADRYLASHTAAGQNGILIFSFGDGGQAKLLDGYSFILPAPVGFRNAFVSPSGGAGQIYIAVVPFGLKYMACGYEGTDTLQSTTAVDGECRDKPGTACVQHNGYSMCSNAVGNLYTSTPTYFVSSMIIHTFLHLFSPGGDKDNYATPECNARMGYPNGFFDLQEAQYYNGICPFVYENFLAAYRP
jgi:hypothetical protein